MIILTLATLSSDISTLDMNHIPKIQANFLLQVIYIGCKVQLKLLSLFKNLHEVVSRSWVPLDAEVFLSERVKRLRIFFELEEVKELLWLSKF